MPPNEGTVDLPAADLAKMLDKAARKAARQAAKASAKQALRTVQQSAANAPDAGKRPGGAPSAANVNLKRPVRASLARAIRSIGRNAWEPGSEIERDFSQAVESIFLHDEHEQGVVMRFVTNPGAFARVASEADINFGQDRAAAKAWAARAADLQEMQLMAAIRGDVPTAQAAYRDAAEGLLGTGGALVPPEYLQQYYTLSLQTSVAFVNAPGVTRIPVKSNIIYFPRETVLLSGDAYAEAATLTETDETFGQQTVVIKKQAAMNRYSNELLADASPEYEGVIGKSLSRRLGLVQDKEYLLGDGTGAHVLGLAYYPGLTAGYSVGTNGDAWGQSYNSTGPVMPGTDFPLSVIANARAAGWEPSAWIAHPNVMDNALAKAKDGQGRYLLESINGVFGAPVPVPNVGALPTQLTYTSPPWKASLWGTPFLMTAQIPMNVTVGSSSDTGTVFTGDFNFAHVLERQAIELARADQIYFTTDQTAVRVTSRTAIVLLAPGAFIAQAGVRAATS